MQSSQIVKVIFISHESSLSGAPILLFNLLQLVKREKTFDFYIVVKRGGHLDDLFRTLGETIVLKPKDYQKNKSFIGKVLDYIKYQKRLFNLKRRMRNADLIFSNTITNGRLLRSFHSFKKPVITYVHELAYATNFFNQNKDSELSLRYSSLFFSPAEAVSDHLTRNLKIQLAKVLPLNYYFPAPEVISSASKISWRKDFLEKYELPENKFYVFGMGVANFRKGIDLFIEVCRVVSHKNNKIHFVWIGDFIEDETKAAMAELVKQYQIDAAFTITGFLEHSSYNTLPFDLLALTSREDPYPLVVLEAAFNKIPAIAFSDTGGIQEFLSNGAGFLVDNLSVLQMAEKILFLSNNQSELEEAGLRAFEVAKNRHANSDLVLSQLRQGMQKVLPNRNESLHQS